MSIQQALVQNHLVSALVLLLTIRFSIVPVRMAVRLSLSYYN